MILILSEKFDYSTYEVIEWLGFLKKKWIRIDSQDLIDIEFIGLDVVLKFNDSEVKLSEVEGYWYRRGHLNLKTTSNTNIPQFDSLLSEEMSFFLEYIYYKLGKLKNLNSFLTEM